MRQIAAESCGNVVWEWNILIRPAVVGLWATIGAYAYSYPLSRGFHSFSIHNKRRASLPQNPGVLPRLWSLPHARKPLLHLYQDSFGEFDSFDGFLARIIVLTTHLSHLPHNSWHVIWLRLEIYSLLLWLHEKSKKCGALAIGGDSGWESERLVELPIGQWVLWLEAAQACRCDRQVSHPWEGMKPLESLTWGTWRRGA